MAQQKIKFPILKNVEYFDVLQNKKLVKAFKGTDLEGLKWREVQEKIGLYASGQIHYTFKFNDSPDIHKGMMRAVNTETFKTQSNQNDLQVQSLKTEIQSLRSQLDNASSSSGVTVEMLLSISKQGYETQIHFLNNEITRKDAFITKLESEIDKLNDELDKQDVIIDELKSKTGLNQYLQLAQSFLNKKAGDVKPLTTLKDSNTSDIPERVMQLLGAIEWSQVSDEMLSNIIHYLEIFIQQLPLKG